MCVGVSTFMCLHVQTSNHEAASHGPCFGVFSLTKERTVICHAANKSVTESTLNPTAATMLSQLRFKLVKRYLERR